ncbi:SRPBCC domain-containing protein [Paenibacillus sp. HJL G12]|uniref:SRPBCC domain-containing protein n=2 Tax=Paenibacillus dendrobii TaxID=2691084 RepID=A0A7X3IP92_9BACL|nr:SRPBCC domain-containing protein [Paenibacillus dendrobii]
MKSSGERQAVKPVGQTTSAGFQIGVRRTFPISGQEAWTLLVSPEGMMHWIGEVGSLEMKPGESFASVEGITGELRVVKPMEQLRMRWQRKDWKHPSTLQIRILPASQGQTTISFHQEKLEDMHAREVMKDHWEQALNSLKEMAGEIKRGSGKENNNEQI